MSSFLVGWWDLVKYTCSISKHTVKSHLMSSENWDQICWQTNYRHQHDSNISDVPSKPCTKTGPPPPPPTTQTYSVIHGNYSSACSFHCFLITSGMFGQFALISINRVLKLKTERTSSKLDVCECSQDRQFMRIMLKSSYPCCLCEPLYSKESLLWWGGVGVSLFPLFGL